MLKALFFSHIYSNNDFQKLLVGKGFKLPAVAVSNYESGFLTAFSKSNYFAVETFNREFYPFVEKSHFSSQELSVFQNETNLCTHKYQSRHFFKSITKTNELKKKLIECNIVFFSTYHDWRFFKYVKSVNPNIKGVLLLPDLPDFLINKSSFKHKIANKLTTFCFYKNCKHIDAVIPITELMGNHLMNSINRQLVIEGVIKDEDIQDIKRDSYHNNIVYSGGLSRKYGVLDLIDAFKCSNASEHYNLVFCGKGECEKAIINESKDNSKIIYKGFLPRKDVLKLLSSSAFLVVPESPLNEYSKYSFHSKILEYLGSGTPMISYLYPGIPREYSDFILKINGDGTNIKDELISGFNHYLKMSKADNIKFGERAREFISKRLSANAVALKIDNFIKGIFE